MSEQELDDPQKLLEWLAPPTYHSQQAEFAQRRHPGSVQWFLHSESYQKWVDAKPNPGLDEQAQDLQTLFCPGPAGAGKTILASAVVEDLRCRFPPGSPSKVGIAYIHCVFHLREELSPSNLLLLLLRQLIPLRPLSPRHAFDEVFDEGHPDGEPPSLDTFTAMLEQVVKTYDRVFFVVDALDECPTQYRTRLLEELFKLQARNPLFLFTTSESDPEIAPIFANKTSLEIRADQDDLRSYLRRCMDQLPAFVGDLPDLRLEIIDSITRAADGRFLLAMLHVQSLADKPSPEAIRAALARLAVTSDVNDYDGAYDAVMERIERQAPDRVDLAKRALSHILCATRLLTVPELRHALAVKAGDTELDRAAMPDMDAISAACAGLVVAIGHNRHEQRDSEHNSEVDEEDEEDEADEVARVRLVHRTTYDYLQRTAERWFPEREKQIATACMAYLSLCYFDDGYCYSNESVRIRLQTYPLYCYAALRWGDHARAAFSKFPDMVKTKFKLLTSKAHIESACQVFFMAKHKADSDESPHGMTTIHIAAYFGITNLIYASFRLESRPGDGDVMINARDGYGRTALAWAAHEGHEDAVRALVKIANVDLDARDEKGRTPVSLATERSHIIIVEILLDHGAHPNFKDFSRASALWYAAKEGNIAMANLLVKHGADVNVAANQIDVGLHTPLSFAAMHGHNEIARLLLVQPGIQSHVKVWPWHMYGGFTSLELAVEGKHYDVVETFLSHSYVSDECEPLLRKAAEQGDEILVQLLLGMDVEVNTRSSHGDTPLHCASKGGHNGVVSLLLSRAGVLPDVSNEDGNTPALLAARGGRFQALQLLLAKGADVGARNQEGRTPLSEAAEQGSLSVVELLLATNGVDADPQDHQGRTPLSLAISSATYVDDSGAMDHRGVVRCLLDSGRVDVNSRDMQGRTPLSFAAESAVEMCLVEMLLEHEGLDVNVMDEYGRTALTWAVYQDRKDTTTLLLKKGADPNLGKLYDGEPPLLSYAARQGNLEIANALLFLGGVDPSQKDCNGHTPLCHAAEKGHVEIMDMLLTAGGLDANAQCDHGQTPLHHAVSGYNNDKRSVVAFLLAIDNIAVDTRDEKGKIPLHYAVQQEDENIVSLLLGSENVGLNYKDEKGKIPLHYAVKQEDETIVSLLLGSENVGLNYKDEKGRTPLFIAAKAGRLSIVKRLLSLDGVIPDDRDNTGGTPLSRVVESRWRGRIRGADEVARRLLRRDDVDPNAADENGWTPLSWAVQGKGASDLVEVLLTEGAGRININHEDRKGRTPLSLALKHGTEVVVGQLQAAGARLGLADENVGKGVRRAHDVLMPDVSVNGEDEEQSLRADAANARGDQQAFEDDTDESEDSEHRRRRRRWMNSDWFDDGSSSGSDWSGTDPDTFGEIFKTKLLEGVHIELGVQAEEHHIDVGGGDQGDKEGLCQQCKAIDLNGLFSRSPSGGYAVIATLGEIDESWKSRRCAMCRLIAAIRPTDGDETYDLFAYSSSATWLSRANLAAHRYFKTDCVDTVVLGLENGARLYNYTTHGGRRRYNRRLFDAAQSLSSGFIGRVGSNDRNHLRAIKLHRLQADTIDFGRARCWIDCCVAHHGKRCNANNHRHIPYVRFIDCETRSVVDSGHDTELPRFVALSYVWGLLPDTQGPRDRRRVEDAEPVVEDAIHVTLALGYRYLWVDRHCITNENQKVRREQLLHMNAVYENAEITIVAAAGQDSTFGLAGVSRARVPRPYGRVQGHVLTAIPPEPRDIIKASTWWTRGWTYQEGLLSRRRLIFTEHELSYECKGMVARETVELPIHVHRIAATRYPMCEHARIFPRRSLASSGRGGEDVWSCIREYTKRRLKLDDDILNAILGIMQVFAERKSPIYHLCGIPLVREKFDKDERRIPTLLEAFAIGLCWHLLMPGTRREGFPSWSWTGWKGRAYGITDCPVSFEDGHSIDVSMVPRNESSHIVSWADFEAMNAEEKASLPGDYRLKITATTAKVSIYKTYWWDVVVYNGDDAFRGELQLCKDPEQDAEFGRRLVEDRWLAIVVGKLDDYVESILLLLVDKVENHCKGEDHWERVGVIQTYDRKVLDVTAGGCTKQTFLID